MAIADADRLLLALKHEAEHSFSNMQGKQQRFADFAHQELAALIPKAPPGEAQDRFKRLQDDFGRYAHLTQAERQDLAARVRAAVPLLAASRQPEGKEGGSGSIAWQASARAAAPSGKAPTQGRPGSAQLALAGTRPAPQPPLEPSAELTRLKGVGPHLAGQLARMGLDTLDNLLAHYPRTYLDYQRRTRIADLKPGERVTIWGTIRRAEAFTPPRHPNLSINTAWIHDGTGTVAAKWFMGRASRAQQEAWKKRFPPGHRILLSGEAKVDRFGGKITFDRPEFEILGPDDDADDASGLDVGRILPVYPLSEGIGQKALRRAIHAALEAGLPAVRDPLPQRLRARFDLQARPAALAAIHFPTSDEERLAARRRLVFEELFWMQLGLAFKKAARERAGDGLVLATRQGGLVEKLLASLPFTLTGAQKRVFEEIRRDLEAPEPMSRLVQGDVGSGKTVVALLALLLAVENGYQGALLAPTEILAEQHYRTFKQLLEPLKLEVALLLGKQTRSERQTYVKALRSGYCKIAVGTHALLQDDVEFERLGLAVVDEQHRFGVQQRAKIRSKGKAAGRSEGTEILTMTATPIPRTLALALYGDLDVSILDELPPGRKPVTTRWLKGKAGRKEAWELVKGEVAKGRQAYVVFPLVEESEKLDVKAATEEYQALQEGALKGLRLGLLHGQLPPADKEAAIAAFRARDLDVLIATTVVEVGVDVPNATVMVVENSERFGLSQLHQLRGRVGRGADESFCILLADGDSEATRARLEVMCASNDGFVIAQKDLELRGPGEFIGTRQSGLPDLVLANLADDTRLLEEARDAARQTIAADPQLERHPELLAGMLTAFRDNPGFLGSG